MISLGRKPSGEAVVCKTIIRSNPLVGFDSHSTLLKPVNIVAVSEPLKLHAFVRFEYRLLDNLEV